jgi:flavin reductase (DIM6/NTAB) family NADH-FMN oxidoreductase RutF
VIGPDEFRRVLGHFATGVTVVTTVDARRRPTGLTISAFASLSLDPPLVLVCVDHKSQTYPALLEQGRFAVNVLALGHEAISRRFATTTPDKFDGVEYADSPLGLPLIEGAIAHIECTTVSTHVEGDHTILVGRVERTTARDGEPLLYFRGKYGRLQAATSPAPAGASGTPAAVATPAPGATRASGPG